MNINLFRNANHKLTDADIVPASAVRKMMKTLCSGIQVAAGEGTKVLGFNADGDPEFVSASVTPPVQEEVTIGTQTWKKDFLDVDDGQGGISTSTNGVKLYTLAAAMRVADSIEGWRLPTKAECEALVSYAKGEGSDTDAWSALTSETGWPTVTYDGTDYNLNGTNSTGFDAKFIQGYRLVPEWNPTSAVTMDGFCIWEQNNINSYNTWYGLCAFYEYDQWLQIRKYYCDYVVDCYGKDFKDDVKLAVRLIKDE